MHTLDAQVGATLVDRADSLVWSTDAQLRVTAARGAALRTSGIDVELLVSRTAAAHHGALSGDAVELDYELCDRLYEVHVAPLRDGSGAISGCIGLARDVTARRRAEQSLIWQSSHDALTGLPNRMSLRERIAQEVHAARRRAGSVAVLLVDVDGMHRINDAAGQDAGDAVLVATAQRISAAAAGSFVSRTGGDSFGVVVREAADGVAAAILEAMHDPFVTGTTEALLTVSIGIAEFPRHGTSTDVLFRSAEAAVRRAIELGGDQVHVSSSDLMVAAAERLGIELRLRRAIAQGDLRLAYQPQVRLSDGALLGLEALLRWNCDGEQLPAAAFIRAVEESAVIIDVGEWVIDEACRQVRAWRDAGCAPSRVALNIGARHFQHPGFLATIRRAIERHRVDPRMLEIEITETTAMHRSDAVMPLIDELRELGIEITIDDFGTGYSSLAYLKRFAITGVKIDRSFVHDLPSSRSAIAIVNAILAAAHALGLRVVAEGVEHPEQAGFLSAAGCDEAQGYWFGRPMSAEATEAYLRSVG